MRNLLFLTVLTSFVFIISCDKDEDDVSERVKYLTGSEWESDSLLVNGMDASVPGGLLESFKGNAKFNEDGTGEFGGYTGTWRFSPDEKDLIITTQSLPFPLTTTIVELTAVSLKVTTGFPNPANPEDELKIRMTFKAN